MGRNVEAASAEGVWVAVNIDDNLTDKDPFEVEVVAMSGRDFQRMETELGLGRLNKGKLPDFIARSRQVAKKAIEKHITGVRNYSIKASDGEMLTPVDGASLLLAVVHESADAMELIIDDVLGLIKDQSTLDERLGKV